MTQSNKDKQNDNYEKRQVKKMDRQTEINGNCIDDYINKKDIFTCFYHIIAVYLKPETVNSKDEGSS